MLGFTLPHRPDRILISVATTVCFAAAVFADPLPGATWQQMGPQQMRLRKVWRHCGRPINSEIWSRPWRSPDPLLGQILAASTYPLEIVEAQQWLQQNPGIAGQALMDALKQQGWDPSVQMLAEFPGR